MREEVVATMTARLCAIILVFAVCFVLTAQGWFFPGQVCYPDWRIGCFTANLRPFTSGSLPASPETQGVGFYLYTQLSPLAGVALPYLDTAALASVPWAQGRLFKVIVHGRDETGASGWVGVLKNYLLARDDVNVVVVEWGGGAAGRYSQAAANSRVVGAMLAEQVKAMSFVTGSASSDFHVIGFDLGAHVAGFAGDRIQVLGRITGLDPAKSRFEGREAVARLDPKDALFVDVIHTETRELGLLDAVGDVDFYVNGGQDQPGCGWNSVGRQCSHARAVELFTNSILACAFVAYPCASRSDFLEGSCTSCGNGSCPLMGYDSDIIVPFPSGVHHLSTTQVSPYC